MVDVTAGDVRIGDQTTPMLPATTITLTATVTKGMGQSVRWVHDGKAMEPVMVSADPFTTTVEAGQGRWRAEVMVTGQPRTVTSHVYVLAPVMNPRHAACGCGTGEGLTALLGLVLIARRRRN
jgi:hypothetical protein